MRGGREGKERREAREREGGDREDKPSKDYVCGHKLPAEVLWRLSVVTNVRKVGGSVTSGVHIGRSCV